MTKKTTKSAAKTAAKTKNAGHKNVEPFKFKKGQSGNPNGGPKGERLSTQIRRALEEIAAKGKNGKEYTNGELILKAMLKKAQNGDVRATELLYDRLEGKPKSGLLNTDDNDIDDAIGSITVTIASK
jgi:hypothetical protein